jgi:hypothetical protein
MRFQNGSEDTQTEATRLYNAATCRIAALDWRRRELLARRRPSAEDEAEFVQVMAGLKAAQRDAAELEVR